MQKLAAVDYLHTGVVCTGELDAMGQAVTIPIWNYRAAADLKITTKMLREWAAEEDRIRRAVPGARKVKKVRGPVTQQQRGGKAWEGKQGVCDELAEACEDGKDREDGEDETGQKSGLEAPIDHLARLSLYDVLEVPH